MLFLIHEKPAEKVAPFGYARPVSLRARTAFFAVLQLTIREDDCGRGNRHERKIDGVCDDCAHS